MRAGDRVGGRFVLREGLVRGERDGAREVWLAYDERMGRDVVLKQVAGSVGDLGHAPGEPRAMAKVNHPHVITVYEYLSIAEAEAEAEAEADADAGGGAEAGDWAVLEYAPRGSLAGTRMSVAQAAGVGAQIAGALEYMHRKGLVHCDVKPGNIVIAEDDAAKLTDFGSAYRAGPEKTVTPQARLSYTPGYAAPEVVVDGNPAAKSDVYSLAATVYALVVGVLPGGGGPPSGGLGALGEPVSAMLRPNPGERPDAARARRLFQAIADEAGPTAAGTTVDPSSTPPAAAGSVNPAVETTIPPAAVSIPPAEGSAGPPVTGSPEGSRPKPQVSTPAQLPADVSGFAGRGGELERLDRLLTTPAEEPPPAVVISAISGTAGVGKTALAVRWARRIAGRFPDGQLYVNLRGFDPSGQVINPADALRGFLDALGVPAERIPFETEARAALYRGRLDGKRILVVLDNARDSDQVRSLLPGSPGCLAVVTSRNDLVGLITRQGARPLALDVLTEAEARQLLDHRLGRDRTAAEPDAVEEIVTACAGLPLALAIVAARAALRPDFPLATPANELRDNQAGLDVFTGGGPDTDVRAVFSWSYEQLGAEAQRLFRLLGLHPGPDLSAPAAASLAALPPNGVRPLLTELTRAHLVSEHVPGRYTFHDLLRTYATELTHTHDTDAERHAAQHRMLDHYLHTAYTADRQLNQRRDPLTLIASRPGVTPERSAGYDQAMAWFTAEHPVLLAALNQAADTGFDVHSWQLAWALETFLYRRGHWLDLAAAWHTALDATQRLDDRPAQARAHRLLAAAYARLDRLEDAHAHLERALDLERELGNRVGQAHTQRSLALSSERQGRYADALDHTQQALHLYRDAGHGPGQAMALNSLGWYHAQLGQYQPALGYCEQALELSQELGDREGEAHTWDSLGYAHDRLHQIDDAAACYQRALDLFRDLGGRYNEATTLSHLGDTRRAAGDPAAAQQCWQQALTILEEVGHPDADGVRARLEALDRPPPQPHGP